MPKKKTDIAIHSSAAEYLTYVASTGSSLNSFEMRYEDENIWMTQKMMATLYDVSGSAIIAAGFKVINERAVRFRKWADQIVKDYTFQGRTMDKALEKGAYVHR